MILSTIQTHCRPLLQTTSRLLVLVAILLGGASAVGAWADSYTYYVINLSHKIATHYTTTAEAGTAPSLPSIIKSPLVADGGYKYYTTLSGESGSYTVSDEITELPSGGGNIYVTYTYTANDANGTINLDLNGASSYYIEAEDPLAANGDNKQQRIVYLVNEAGDLFSSLDGAIYNSVQWWPCSFMTSKEGRTKEGYQWLLEGGDPYNIYLRSKYAQRISAANQYAAADDNQVALTFFAKDTYNTSKATDLGKGIVSYFLNVEGDFIAANDKQYNGQLVRFGKKLTSHGSRMGNWNRAISNEYHPLYNIKFIPDPAVPYKYVVVDLSNKTALTSQMRVGQVGMTLALDDFMKSPLVDTYTYYTTYDSNTGLSNPVTTLPTCAASETRTIYVGYTPKAVATASLKLDGSADYHLFNKLQGADGIFGLNGVRTNTMMIPFTDATQNYRPQHYTLQLYGTEVGGSYDPYDVRVYVPNQGSRYWTNNISATVNQNAQQVTVSNSSDRFYYMILNGSSANYVEMMVRKRKNDTYNDASHTAYYQYVYFDGTKLNARQHTTENPHGQDNKQLYFQPAYTYHVLTLAGKEAISAVGTKMDMSLDGTTQTAPSLPGIVSSPLISQYHYYDISAFDVDLENNVYTLKSNASELAHLKDATTKDIYVVYKRPDISTSLIDLTGQMSYNMQVNGRYAYYNSSDNNDLNTTDATTAIQDNSYLWQFTGGDPYALKLVNASRPDNVVSNFDEESGYRGRMGIVSPVRAISTYMLLRGYGSDGYDYRLMGSPAAVVDKQNNPYYYQYVGGNWRNWTTAAPKVAWVNAGDHNQYYYQTSAYIQLKFTRQNAASGKSMATAPSTPTPCR